VSTLTFSGCGKIISNVQFCLTLSDMICRSIAIDDVFSSESTSNALYIFFDYKDVRNQTAKHVASSLLKQLVRVIQFIPSSLEQMYDYHKNETRAPTLSSLMDVFITQANHSFYIVFFDAFDECGEQGLVYSELVQRLYDEGMKVCITHRPHVLKSPEVDFQDFTRVEIRARDEYIESYIRAQLAMHQKPTQFDDTFRIRIINAILHQANGMYAS
jgi:hypothetical protein